MSHKLPQTSHDAHNSIQEMKPDHHAKILEALKVMKEASAEQIAAYLGMQHSQINRRVSELHDKKLIYRPGNKVTTSTGRSAYTWKLVEEGVEPEISSEKFPEGKSFTEFAKELNCVR